MLWKRVFAMTSTFSWQNSMSLCPASFCTAPSNLDSSLCFTSPAFHMMYSAAAAAAKSRQSCPTLCNSIDGSPPGSPIPGILQAYRFECSGYVKSGGDLI